MTKRISLATISQDLCTLNDIMADIRDLLSDFLASYNAANEVSVVERERLVESPRFAHGQIAEILRQADKQFGGCNSDENKQACNEAKANKECAPNSEGKNG